MLIWHSHTGLDQSLTQSSAHSNVEIFLAGFPAATHFGGIALRTTDPAAMTE
jgi:hypothetical protein